MAVVDVANLRRAFAEKRAFVGMGYVGLPLMLAATGVGFEMTRSDNR